MGLIEDHTGILVASICAIILIIIVVTLSFARDRVCLPFSRFIYPCSRSSPTTAIRLRNLPTCDMEAQIQHATQESTQSEEKDGDYEQYGELYIGPSQKPTGVAIDIITRMLMSFGLPAKAQLKSEPPEYEHASPYLELDLPKRDSLSPSEQVNFLMGYGNSIVGARKESPTNTASVNYHTITNNQQKDSNTRNKGTDDVKAGQIRKGNWSDVALDNLREYREDGLALNPISFTFGSGKSLAALYR